MFKVTIAICTYRRFDMLTKCLDAIRNQIHSIDDFRILIVDNSLQPEISQTFRDNLKEFPNIEYFVTDRSGLSYARNFAIELCNTDFIAFIDDDSIIHADWGDNLIFALSRFDSTVGALGGKVLPIWTIKRPDWIGDRMLSALTILDWGDEEFELTDFNNKWLVGANIIYNTIAVKKVGGFSEQLGRNQGTLICHEELDLNIRLHEAGYKILYCPNIKVDHFVHGHRVTKEHFCELMFSEGISRGILNKTEEQIKDDLTLLEDFLDPQKNTERHLFTDVDDPNLFLDKMTSISNLGRLLYHSRRIIEQIPEVSFSSNKEEEGLYMAKSLKAFSNTDKLTINGIIPPVIDRKCSFLNQIWMVIPCLNASKTIEETLASIFSQEGNFVLHLHVQDGGSTDGTLEIVENWRKKALEKKSPEINFSIDSSNDNGLYDAINKGFKLLSVPDDAFMSWLNADDVLSPNTLNTVTEIAKEFASVHWICGYRSNMTENGNLTRESVTCENTRYHLMHGLCDSKHSLFFQQEGSFWRGWLWNEVGGVNTNFKLAGDYDLWVRFAQRAEIFPVDQVFATYRIRPNALSRNFWGYMDEIESSMPLDYRVEWNNVLLKLLSTGYVMLVPLVERDKESNKLSIEWKNSFQVLPSISKTLLNYEQIDFGSEQEINTISEEPLDLIQSKDVDENLLFELKDRLNKMGLMNIEEFFNSLSEKELFALYNILLYDSSPFSTNMLLIKKLDELFYFKNLDFIDISNEIDLLKRTIEIKDENIIEQGQIILNFENEVEEKRIQIDNSSKLINDSLQQIIDLNKQNQYSEQENILSQQKITDIGEQLLDAERGRFQSLQQIIDLKSQIQHSEQENNILKQRIDDLITRSQQSERKNIEYQQQISNLNYQLNTLNEEKIAKKTLFQNQIDENQNLAKNLMNEIDGFKNSITYKIISLLGVLMLVFHPKIVVSKYRKWLIFKRNCQLISRNRLFDGEYYLKNNLDVLKSGVNPVKHYLLFGGIEGRNPSEIFDSAFYLKTYPDVKETGINPLLHYILFGKKEARKIKSVDHSIKQEVKSPVLLESEKQGEISNERAMELILESGLFDITYYCKTYADIREAGVDPLFHFFYTGWKENRNPSENFNTKYYLKSNPDVASSGMNPLFHYILVGCAEGRSAKPDYNEETIWTMSGLFDANFYKEQLVFPTKGMSKVDHFINHGIFNEIAPNRRVAKKILDNSLHHPLISIIIPVYNSPIRFLSLAIDSVLNQIYQNWELIVVDDGSTSKETLDYLKTITSTKNRIHITLLEKNQGISNATNRALSEVKGDFIAFFDHDDLLTPNCLLEIVYSYNQNPETDVFYTDQTYIDENGNVTGHFYKPDWSPWMFRGVMYICHLLVVRNTIIKEINGFLPSFDFIQDFEFMLRVSEKAKRIVHIPKALYHWRQIQSSVAGGGKRDIDFETLQSNAVNNHFLRQNIPFVSKKNPIHPHRLILESTINSCVFNVLAIIMTENAISENKSRKLIDSISSATSHKKIQWNVISVKEKDSINSLMNLINKVEYDYLLILNENCTPTDDNWLSRLLSFNALKGVGAVGPMITNNGKVISSGLIVSKMGIQNAMNGFDCNSDGYAGSLCCIREVSTISPFCVVIKKEIIPQSNFILPELGIEYSIINFLFESSLKGNSNLIIPQIKVVTDDISYFNYNKYSMSNLYWKNLKAKELSFGDKYYNRNFNQTNADYTV